MKAVCRARLLLLVLVASCGGSEAAPVSSPSRSPATPSAAVVRPIELEVQGTRVGQSVRLDVTGIGRGHLEGGIFEDPSTWSVRAFADGHPLQHLVNGPVQVARDPAGRADGDQWDITVRFSMVFAMPEQSREVEVQIAAPNAAPYQTTLTGL